MVSHINFKGDLIWVMKKFSLIEKLLKTFDKYAILVAVIALFSVIVFYLATFNQGLRKDNGDWRTFGNEA